MATSHISILVLLFLSLTPLSFSQKCHPNDKKALLQIKKDLNNPPILTTWEPKSDCCSDWRGLECNETTNRIIGMNIFDSALRLPIPSAVGDLPHLKSLQLYNISATGQIPPAISKLSNLETLELRFNHLTGPVPPFLGRLQTLRYIGLTSNRLTGSIPASLSQIRELDVLALGQNKLTGNIPESFVNFTNLYLFVSDNRLSGPISLKLGSADFLGIDVSRNRMEGDFSFMFGKNKRLETADFSRNVFEFDLTNVELPEQLQILRLEHNKIYGSLPKDLFSSTRIHNLNVSSNRLCGPIPEFRRNQTFDISVLAHNKCLCGKPLPECK